VPAPSPPWAHLVRVMTHPCDEPERTSDRTHLVFCGNHDAGLSSLHRDDCAKLSKAHALLKQSFIER